MTTLFGNVRVIPAVFGAMFGLFAAGCETETFPADPVTTVPESTNTTSAVLNDDPNCEIVIKHEDRNVPNEGQVHYVNRVLTCEPFGSSSPVCVQYNDTRTGEVTLWKDPSNRGTRTDTMPSGRGIDKIVVWYN
jgi:hypothetical protein